MPAMGIPRFEELDDSSQLQRNSQMMGWLDPMARPVSF